MDSFIVFLILYTLFIIFDLVPSFKKEEKKVLFFSIPVYILTFMLDTMFSFGSNLVNPNQAITDFISSVFHIS
ncbi:hypothetical protein CAGA_19590 [Caproiciproducens galactitolivorans]|uniref:Uncharacterized protein n=1 Tax=Caproiciproducens galactitolivorans TaxID=642589 RepID=A0A4Z0YB02_9FIRM|nr:hypothetical protein CAGA_19590 [Caproiciproducens galactitolivorans]